MSNVLQGKVALITGGSRGIGAATARRLAADGAHVAISYVSAAGKAQAVVDDLRAAGVEAAAFACDQADSIAARRLVADVITRFGRLDILINNAGLFLTGAIDDAGRDHEAFERQLAVNLSGVAAVTYAAARSLEAGGRIITLGSTGASRSPFTGLGDYSATKAAMEAYTRAWSRDLGPRGITVNLVRLGPIDTDMSPDMDSEAGKAMIGLTSLGRFGRPEEVADVISFLASSPGAAYMTGSVVTLDGGQLA